MVTLASRRALRRPGNGQRWLRIRRVRRPLQQVVWPPARRDLDVASQDRGSLIHRHLRQVDLTAMVATQHGVTIVGSHIGDPVALAEHGHEVPAAVDIGHPDWKRPDAPGDRPGTSSVTHRRGSRPAPNTDPRTVRTSEHLRFPSRRHTSRELVGQRSATGAPVVLFPSLSTTDCNQEQVPATHHGESTATEPVEPNASAPRATSAAIPVPPSCGTERQAGLVVERDPRPDTSALAVRFRDD